MTDLEKNSGSLVFEMGDEKSLGVMGNTSRDRDRELLIPVADSVDHGRDDDGASVSSSHHHSGREVCLLCADCFLSLLLLFPFRVLRGNCIAPFSKLDELSSK